MPWYHAAMTTTAMEERVSRLEGAYEQVDRRLGDLTDSITRLEAQFDGFRSEINAKFNTLIIVMATGGIAIAGAIVTLALRI